MILILVQFDVIDGPKGSTLACSQEGQIMNTEVQKLHQTFKN